MPQTLVAFAVTCTISQVVIAAYLACIYATKGVKYIALSK